MSSRSLTHLLWIGLAFGLVSLVGQARHVRLPGNRKGYEPAQPIAYSHRLHAGELEIPCLYCHFGAEQSRHAGIPSASVCMNCHKFVTAPLATVREEEERAKKEGRAPRPQISPELGKLYDALGLNDKLERDPSKPQKPIQWVRVHQLPDFAYFDHRAHQAAGVECQRCHGPIQSMDRVRQQESLSMGWCVSCHRESSAKGVAGKPVHASTDCVVCHY